MTKACVHKYVITINPQPILPATPAQLKWPLVETFNALFMC